MRIPLETPTSLPPTVERWHRGEVERLGSTIQDNDGAVGDPYRAVDTLMILERKGSITPEMHKAGEIFHTDFITAGFEQLRAASFEQVSHGNGRQIVTGLQIDARGSVHGALRALGGPSSPAGCCAWFVLGVQCSLKEWADRQGWRQRSIDRRTATGILIGTLGILAVNYNLAPR